MLSVVHEDAGLGMQTKQGVRAQDSSPKPPLSTAGDPRMVSGSGSRGRCHRVTGKWKTAFGIRFLGMLGAGGFWRLAEGNRAQVTSPGWAGLLGVAGRGVVPVTYPYSPTWAQSFAHLYPYTLKASFATI